MRNKPDWYIEFNGVLTRLVLFYTYKLHPLYFYAYICE